MNRTRVLGRAYEVLRDICLLLGLEMQVHGLGRQVLGLGVEAKTR